MGKELTTDAMAGGLWPPGEGSCDTGMILLEPVKGFELIDSVGESGVSVGALMS